MFFQLHIEVDGYLLLSFLTDLKEYFQKILENFFVLCLLFFNVLVSAAVLAEKSDAIILFKSLLASR